MWTKTRVDAPGNTRVPTRVKPCPRRARARADWYSGHSRDGGTAKIAQQSLGEGYVCFPQLAPIPMSDILRLRLLGRCRMNLCPVLVCTYAPRRTPYTRMLSRVEAWTVYKYNETCEPHNITSLLSLARDID